jgi:hypothetical protein
MTLSRLLLLMSNQEAKRVICKSKKIPSRQKIPMFFPHFIIVHDSLLDEKLFENTQSDLLRFVDIIDYISIGKNHYLWSNKRKD